MSYGRGELPALLAYRCADCSRLSLRWAGEAVPKRCDYPTCRGTRLEPHPLRRQKDSP